MPLFPDSMGTHLQFTRNHPEYANMDQWFCDGVLNTCYNCLDRHAHVDPHRVALIYDSPLTNTNTIKKYTYSELLDEVSEFAHALSNKLGVKKGNAVVIYIPIIPEKIIAMLACTRIGAVHSVVFGGFASRELSSRIDHREPKLIISVSCGLLPGGRTLPYKRLLDDAIYMSKWKGVWKCIIVQREGVLVCDLRDGMDVSYRELMDDMKVGMDAVLVPSMHVSNKDSDGDIIYIPPTREGTLLRIARDGVYLSCGTSEELTRQSATSFARKNPSPNI